MAYRHNRRRNGDFFNERPGSWLFWAVILASVPLAFAHILGWWL